MYLHVVPRAGLANRLRALAAGLWVANDASIPLVVSWAPDFMTSVPFEALFTTHLDQDAARLAPLATVRLDDPTAIDLRAAGADGVLEVRSCVPFSHRPDVPAYSPAFWSAVRPYLRRLQPVPEVRRAVERVHAAFSRGMLGVHVRSGSGPVSFPQADQVRLEDFFEEIGRILAAAPRTGIFLACDSAASVAQFRDRYGDRVVTSHAAFAGVTVGSFDSPGGARMSLTDLLLLSKTRCILGSFFSSFSAVAAVIGGQPIRRLGGAPGETGGESRFEFFVEPSFAQRAAWKLRRLRLGI
jgi:hypothetical protein